MCIRDREDGPPMFSQDNTCPDLLDFTIWAISYTGLSPSTVKLSSLFYYSSSSLRAVPRSLAATQGISVDFFSSGYLDVSVPRVRSCKPMDSATSTCLTTGGFPHSEILGSKSVCRLPEAYRRLLRPSSPLTAKASTVCAYSLDHITPKSRYYTQQYKYH